MPLGYTGGNFSYPPNEITITAGTSQLVPPGEWFISLGPYTELQNFDSNAGFWREVIQTGGNDFFSSDGTNYRLINRTGQPAGAVMTNLGSGYTSVPTVTPSAGGSVWRAIVGGALSTSVTVAAGGSYNYVPRLIWPPPPPGGITATGKAIISAGAIQSVTMVNRGAGYAQAPTGVIAVPVGFQNLQGALNNQGNNVIIVPDSRETGTGGGSLTFPTALAGSAQVTAILCLDPGTTTLTTLPTINVTGGGGSLASATVIMNWTVTGQTVATAGGGFGVSSPFRTIGSGLLNTTTPATGDLNPAYNTGLTQPRNFALTGTTTAAGGITATVVIEDAGWGIQQVPSALVLSGSIATTATVVSVTVGGTDDLCYLQSRKI